MHLIILLLAVTVAYLFRFLPLPTEGSWEQRWQKTLGLFLFSPLLLLAAAIAIVCMGPAGQMVRWWEGWFSYSVAIAFLAVAGGLAIKLGLEGWRSLQQVRSFPQYDLKDETAHLLNAPVPFVARVGFWHSELVVSQGLLDALDEDHLQAVLTHEQAHSHYRDTFWFFWLGWLRRLTTWLPQSDRLWQELLLLREHRADCWAAQKVDTLLLAESLLQMVCSPELYSENICAAFNGTTAETRLEERIEVLLSNPDLPRPVSVWVWFWLLLGLVPLLVVPFHY